MIFTDKYPNVFQTYITFVFQTKVWKGICNTYIKILYI